MGKLEKDLDAVLSLFKESVAMRFNWGYLSAEGRFSWCADFPWGLGDGVRPQIQLKDIKKAFSTKPPYARIGLVYLDKGYDYEQFWVETVRDRMPGIAGVVVLLQNYFESSMGRKEQATPEFKESRKDVASKARYFFSRLPEELFEAGLPVLFDESGVFEELSPKSEHVETGCLSFLYPSEFPGNSYVFGNRYELPLDVDPRWRAFPIVEIPERNVVKTPFRRECTSLAERSVRLFSREFCRIADLDLFSLDKTLSFRSVAGMLRCALPGCLDEEFVNAILSRDHRKNSVFERRYSGLKCLVAVRKEHLPEYDRFVREVIRTGKILELCLCAVEENREDLPRCRHYDADVLKTVFRNACERNSVACQIAALDAGVPIEDIVA